MEFVVIECPNCGAKLKIKEDQESVICEYCDSQVFVDDGTEKVEYIDKARIKEAELESKRIDELRWEKEKELEELHRWEKIRNGWFAAVIALFALSAMPGLADNISDFASAIFGCILVAGLVVWGIKPKPGKNTNTGGGTPRPNMGTGTSSYRRYKDYKETPGRDPRFDPIETPEERLPWYIRTGWIIVIGLFTEGIYWIIGPIVRVWWKKNH